MREQAASWCASAIRLASRAVHVWAVPWIIASGSLRREHFASRFDSSQSVLTPCFRHACFAMASPTPKHRLAAQRARDRIGWARFDSWRAPSARCVWPRLRGLARRCEQRRSLRSGNAAALIFRFTREPAKRCAFVEERFAEHLREASCDRPQAFSPMRQRECEFVRGAAIRQMPF
jgi:hypothetical protein